MKTLNNHAPECLQLLSTPLRQMAIWLVESSNARRWKHHRTELVEFVNPGMLFQEGKYPVYQPPNHTAIDGMKNIRFDNSHQGDTDHIPESAFGCSNCSIIQIFSWLPFAMARIASDGLMDIEE